VSNPLKRLIDRAVRCTKCGTPRSVGCKCWVRLVCTECGAETTDERIPEYFDLDVVETVCPKCRKGH
jgi:hypothetical protein